jgi:single-strand DNA-binding protein
MVSVNRVVMAGNLTRDPNHRRVAKGGAVASFGLAVNERFRTQDGGERTDTCFVDVETWGKQADACSEHLRKGALALVEGRLRLNSWQDKETGARRSKIVLRADRVHFLSPDAGPLQ